jgi:hypothetical protein
VAEFRSQRRYCLYKRFNARDERKVALELLWRGYQEAEPGTILPNSFPARAKLVAVGYVAGADLVGADADELRDYAMLTPQEAKAVLAAIETITP